MGTKGGRAQGAGVIATCLGLDGPQVERRREHVCNRLPGEEQHPTSDGKRAGLVRNVAGRISLLCAQIPAASACREGIKFLVR